MFNIFF